MGSTISFDQRHPPTRTETRKDSHEAGTKEGDVAEEPRSELCDLVRVLVVVGERPWTAILFILVS